MITLASLDGLKNVSHGFFTRAGGISVVLYAGLNCGIGVGSRIASACLPMRW